ncbi:MAG: stage III sporulation protein AF [Eubacteriales bacterium]
MEGLKELIKNLAFILLLATFLEILLPEKSMRGFVRLIMGLFVISAVLTPVTSIFNMDFVNEVPAWTTTSSRDMPVLASGVDSDNVGREAVREQYRKILINQIKVLVLNIDGIKEVEVNIEFLESDDEPEGYADYPEILKVNIIFSLNSVSIKPIEKIDMSNNEQISDKFTIKEKEVKEKIVELMQIPEEKVFVYQVN